MTPRDLALALESACRALSAPGSPAARLARAWLLHLADLDRESLPASHRGWFDELRAAMSSTERRPLSRDEAERWAATLVSVTEDLRRADLDALPPHARPTRRGCAVVR